MITHPIAPLYNENSKILILGSFPSVKSRRQLFFYGHPQNRFWRVLAAVLGCGEVYTIDEKRRLALEHGVALWDVIAECEIEGSADSSIKSVRPNNLAPIFNTADIRRIYLNGRTAEKYFNIYTRAEVSCDSLCLPSTSPANAAWSLQKLIGAWSVITNDLY